LECSKVPALEPSDLGCLDYAYLKRPHLDLGDLGGPSCRLRKPVSLNLPAVAED